MYCTSCGSQNEDAARFCKNCGRGLSRSTQETGGVDPTPSRQSERPTAAVPIPNYLVQAILVTIFCCLPFGIVSIVYAAQVNTKFGAGDIVGARQASSSAKTWAWVSFGVGLLFVGGYFAVLVLGAAASFWP